MNIYFKLLLLLAAIALQHGLSAQDLKEYENQIFEKLHSGELEIAVMQYDTLAQMAKRHRDSFYLSEALTGKAELLKMMERNHESALYFQKALNLHRLQGNNKYMTLCNLSLSTLKRNQGELDSALYFLTQASQGSARSDSTLQVKINNEYAIYYADMGRGDSAIQYYLRAFKYTPESNGYFRAVLYGNIGNELQNRYSYTEALRYFDEGLSFITMEKTPRIYTLLLLNKAIALVQLNRYEDARKIFHRIEDLDLSGFPPSYLQRHLIWSARLAMKQDDLAEAGQYFDSLDSMASLSRNDMIPGYYLGRMKYALARKYIGYFERNRKTLDSVVATSSVLLHKISWHGTQAKFYQLLGEHKKASEAYAHTLMLRDSFSTLSQQNIISDMEKRYQSKIQKQNIQLLESENMIVNQKLSNSRLFTTVLAVGSVLVILLLFRVFRLNNKLAEALRQKETLLKEIHHRVKNNLQFIASLLRLQANSISDQSTKDVLRQGQDRVHSMSLIHQRLYQNKNITEIEMQDYFSRLSDSLFDSYHIDPQRIQMELDIDPVSLDIEKAIPLGLIANELISNAFKYAFADEQRGSISIQLKEKTDHLSLVISDNGIGLEAVPKPKPGSFGYKLIYTLVKQLDGNINFDLSAGTHIHITTPNKKK